MAQLSGAIQARDLERVAVDTTAQPKAVAHPTDARPMHRALEELVKLARREGVDLRQSYARAAKRAAIMVGRYIHAHQFKRDRLSRVNRDLRRKIEGDAALAARFGALLDLAVKVRRQDPHQHGQKIYSLHAPEVERIGKGTARTLYEFGCKAPIARLVTQPEGGQLVLHAKALHGPP